MSKLGDKVFGEGTIGDIDHNLVENLKATLKAMNTDFSPEVVTATKGCVPPSSLQIGSPPVSNMVKPSI